MVCEGLCISFMTSSVTHFSHFWWIKFSKGRIKIKLTCSQVQPSTPRSCWEFTLQIHSQMGKNTRRGETRPKKQSLVPSAVMERTVIYLTWPWWWAIMWLSTKLAQGGLGKELQKRWQWKNHHNRKVGSATRAQRLWCLPLLTQPPSNRCAASIWRRGKKVMKTNLAFTCTHMMSVGSTTDLNTDFKEPWSHG